MSGKFLVCLFANMAAQPWRTAPWRSQSLVVCSVAIQSLLVSKCYMFQMMQTRERIKVHSHIACRAHAAPMPFPCHAMPLRVWNVSFPFDLHNAAVSDLHLPCRAHAAPMPCSDNALHLKATTQHGRRKTACGLPARIRLLSTTTRISTKIVIRNITILLTTIHICDCKEW